MKLYSRLGRNEFIDELKLLTTKQTPSMYKESSGHPFWGFIEQDSLKITSNNRFIPNLVEIVAELAEEQEGTVITLKIKNLHLPLSLFLISVGIGSTIQFIEAIQNSDILKAVLSIIYGTAIILLILLIAKMQGDWLIKKFIRITSANNGEYA